MTDQVVTQLVIDADVSQAENYTRAMQGAADVTTNFLTVTLAAGVGIGAIFAGLRAAVDQVGGINKQYADIADSARNAQMSVREFQETLYAAKSRGVTDKDFVSGLDRISDDLLAASRSATDFGKLFEKNGLSIKDANGDLKTTKDALADISNLVKNAPTPDVEQAILRIVGLTKDWLPLLRDGSDEIDNLKTRAESLGVIVDDNIVQQASEFDKEWKTAVAAWDLQFKAALGGVLPLLIQAANLAATILEAAGKATSFVTRSFTPIEDQSTTDIEKQIAAVQSLRNNMQDVKDIYDLIRDPTSLLNTQGTFFDRLRASSVAVKRDIELTNQKSMLLGDGQADLQTADDMLAKLKNLAFWKKQLIDLPSVDGVNPAVFGNKATKLPDIEEQSDALDRAIEQLEKHTARTQADTEAVGLGASALAQSRAEASLYTAAQQAGYTGLEKYADKFYSLAESAGKAAQALELAKVASQIDFGAKTAFLGPQDLQIAQQLRGIYGNDVPAALASSEAAALRVNMALKDISDTGRSVATSFATDFTHALSSGSNAWSSFAQAGTNALNKISDKLLSMAVDNLWSKAFGGAGSGLLGGLGSFFGLGSSGPGNALPSNALPGGGYSAPIGPTLPGFADGTTSAPGGWSIVGEHGPERMYVPNGAQIVPNGGSPANDNSPVNVHFAPVYNVTGNTQDIVDLKQQMARDRAEFESRTIAVVKSAQKTRKLK